MKILFLFVFSTLVLFSQQKEITLTIDDLPVATQIKDITFQQRVTKNLLSKVLSEKVHVIGFVNEQKCYSENNIDSARVELLEQWLKNDFDLGNHTFSHPSFHDIPYDSFSQDFLKGDLILKTLWTKYNKTEKYFRHPYLHTGRDTTLRNNFNSLLKQNNYKVAPVTIDNSEWVYAFAYEKAFIKNDSTLMNKLKESYLNYMLKCVKYYEDQSFKLLGRNIKHSLLIHANLLNSDVLDKLIKVIKDEGYSFISLKETLTDSAYQLPDNFVGRGGISWMHRWAITQGFKGQFFAGEPEPEDYVYEAAEIKK